MGGGIARKKTDDTSFVSNGRWRDCRRNAKYLHRMLPFVSEVSISLEVVGGGGGEQNRLFRCYSSKFTKQMVTIWKDDIFPTVTYIVSPPPFPITARSNIQKRMMKIVISNILGSWRYYIHVTVINYLVMNSWLILGNVHLQTTRHR